jgi:hypothetical protein
MQAESPSSGCRFGDMKPQVGFDVSGDYRLT